LEISQQSSVDDLQAGLGWRWVVAEGRLEVFLQVEAFDKHLLIALARQLSE